MTGGTGNIAQSLRDRLLNISRQRKEDFQIILQRFTYERFLYRMENSQYSDSFILKGGFLFTVWAGDYYRTTKDLDFLMFGSTRFDEIKKRFEEICETKVETDGLKFDTSGITVTEIRQGSSYQGIRVKFLAHLAGARIPLQFDIGIGDSVVPEPRVMEYPSILDFPKPNVRVYPPETMISEKFEAMVDLGFENSRLKDFYDIYALIHLFTLDGRDLQKAVTATFTGRKTAIPTSPPIALTDEFFNDASKITQWMSFIKRFELVHAPENLEKVAILLTLFIMPIFKHISEEKVLNLTWNRSTLVWE